MTADLTYTDPRLRAEFTDWPYGRQRTRCIFVIEHKHGHGQRAVRVTVDPKTGREAAPKALTYVRQAVIVTGSDGRTYIAELSYYGFITIRRGDMQCSHEAIHPDSPRFEAVRALFDAVGAQSHD